MSNSKLNFKNNSCENVCSTNIEQNSLAYANYVYDRDFNTPEKQKQRAEFILNSNVDLERKLEDLSYNPFSGRDIVKYIIWNGKNIENVFYPDKLLDEQGNDFRDFIESDNNFYFGAIEKLLDKIDFKARRNIDLIILIEKCYQAVKMWNSLNNLYEALPYEDFDIDDFKNFYYLAIDYIYDCADYAFENSITAKMHYIESQNEYLIKTLCEPLDESQRIFFTEYCKKIKDLINK